MGKALFVYRGDYLESTHDIHVAVVNSEGKLLYFYGDPYRFTFPRSSMKPFQAIPVVETGAADALGYDDKDLSLICASHSGEKIHRERVLNILSRLHLDESYLQCGTHIPRDIEGYNEMIRNGGELTPVFSNCSGKHSGMLTTVVHLGENVHTYRDINHPHQQRILESIEEVCHFPKEKIEISVDGCGVPVHRLPLFHTAYGYATLANPEILSTLKKKEAIQRIWRAMTTAPEMVGGTNRFDTDLMRAFNGRILAKAGAEGVQCIADRETGIGIAIKVEDGNERGTYVTAMEVLRQLQIGNEEIYHQLEKYVHAPVLNARKEKIGIIKANFELKVHSTIHE